LERGRPLGEDKWTQATARRLGVLFTLNPRGRPKKELRETRGKTEK